MLGNTLEEWQGCVEKLGLPKFRGVQIWDWVYTKGVTNFSDMTNLGVAHRQSLQERISIETLKLLTTSTSSSGDTTKFLFELSDGKLIEAVLIEAPHRYTVCVSSQVGCPVRCAFCASGKEGLIRNLSASEIVEQVYHIDRMLKAQEKRVSHVVYMGMGEPLENYEAVLHSIKILNDAKGLNISQRRMTVSTAGVLPGIERFTNEGLQVHLVLSLHASNQKLRQRLIPYARRYTLFDLLSAMRKFQAITRREVTYEYTLIEGVNDSPEQAKELALLLKGDLCTVNLIPYNPVEGIRWHRPEKEAIIAFRAVLEKEGINVTWRYTKGTEIDAACGQLAMRKKDPTMGLVGLNL